MLKTRKCPATGMAGHNTRKRRYSQLPVVLYHTRRAWRTLRRSSMAILALIDAMCAVIMWLWSVPLIGAAIEGMQPVWFVAVLIVSVLIVGWLMARLARWTWEQAEKEAENV